MPRTAFVANFLGQSNLIEGSRSGAAGDDVVVAANGLSFAIPSDRYFAEGASAIVGNAPKSIEAGQFFLDMIPSNVVTAAAENQILPVMVFALFFGIGLVMAKSPATDRLQQVIEGMFEVTMKLINLFIKLAPIAIACLMFNLAALFGWELLVRLAAFVGVAVGAMAGVE